MDNQTYLNQISAKPLKAAKSQGKFSRYLTPTNIKIAAGLLIALVLLIVVMNILGQAGARVKYLTEKLYIRTAEFSKTSGLIDTYSKNLYSSDLRALTSNLRTSLSNISRDVEHLLPDLSINAQKISAKVTEEETKVISELTTTLEYARLNSLLDRTFSIQMTLEIARLVSMQTELYEKTENQAFRDLLQRTRTSLELLEVEFTNFTNSH